MIVLYGVVTVHCTALHSTTESKDNIVKDKVIESAKLRKMFMPSVHTRGQQQWRVVKGRGTPGPGQLLTPHGGNAPPAPCAFICSLETLEDM